MLSEAVEQFRAFVNSLQPAQRLVGMHDWDADGLTAGVIWQRTFERLGFPDVRRVMPDRRRDAWSETNRARARAAEPGALFLLDLGSKAEELVPGVPLCIVDHHHPDGIPPRATLISAYSWSPIPNTSLLMFELGRSVASIDDLDWIAAIGTISDLGERAPFALIAAAKKTYTARALKEVTTLVNAARRAASFDPERAARLLLSHDSPSSILESGGEDLEALQAARAEVNAELAKGKMAAPKFAGNVALVRVSSRCQIHPLIAQIWRSRLPEKYVVIVANDAFLADRVNFSARSMGSSNARELLRSVQISGDSDDYGHGHDHASGGSLSPDRWNEFLAQLGFPHT